MSFGYSPYDVQARQGGRFTFDTVKKRYQDTIPLRGKRKAENVRPINRRDRYWERVFEVNENEYYISFDSYKYRTNHNKAISWSLNNGVEYMTIHTPKRIWSDNGLHPRAFSSASVFWFYDFNLPHEFNMVNYRANKYVRYAGKFYTIELGDITFQRKQGGSPTDWQPLVVHREFKHSIDRKQTKELRQIVQPFLDYYDLMSGMVEGRYAYGNPIKNAIEPDHGKPNPSREQVLSLFKQQNDTIPDQWLEMVEKYKRRIYVGRWDRNALKYTQGENRNLLPKQIYDDLFELVKPCKAVEVPLGSLSYDRYKQWYR